MRSHLVKTLQWYEDTKTDYTERKKLKFAFDPLSVITTDREIKYYQWLWNKFKKEINKHNESTIRTT